MTKTRNTPQTWISAGIKALTKSGVDGIRAETLARQLGTTKGSFYWHFKDVPEFHAALLASWSKAAENRFKSKIDLDDTAISELRAVAKYKPMPADLAVRSWAAHDAKARKTVDKFDQMVLAALKLRLDALDATHPDFPRLILAAVLATPKSGSHAETLIDLLLVLK